MCRISKFPNHNLEILTLNFQISIHSIGTHFRMDSKWFQMQGLETSKLLPSHFQMTQIEAIKLFKTRFYCKRIDLNSVNKSDYSFKRYYSEYYNNHY